MKMEINHLDCDSLLWIFSHLPVEDKLKLQDVCQKWEKISPFIWSNIKILNCPKIYSNNKGITQLDIESIIKQSRKYLKQLVLSNNLKVDSILNNCKLCVNINWLDLSNACDVNDNTIIFITQNFKKLSYLDISNNWELTKKSLMKLGELKNLKSIILNDVVVVDDEIVDQFKNMKQVEFAISRVTEAAILKIINNSKELEVLNIAETNVTVSCLSFASFVCDQRQRKLKMLVNRYLYNYLDYDLHISPFLTLEIF